MLSNADVLKRHMTALLAYDLETVINGYADDAVQIANGEVTVGKEAIAARIRQIPREYIEGLDQPRNDVEIHQGEYTVTIFHQPNMKGSDTFHIRDGKILLQTAFAVHSDPPPVE